MDNLLNFAGTPKVNNILHPMCMYMYSVCSVCHRYNGVVQHLDVCVHFVIELHLFDVVSVAHIHVSTVFVVCSLQLIVSL